MIAIQKKWQLRLNDPEKIFLDKFVTYSDSVAQLVELLTLNQ